MAGGRNQREYGEVTKKLRDTNEAPMQKGWLNYYVSVLTVVLVASAVVVVAFGGKQEKIVPQDIRILPSIPSTMIIPKGIRVINKSEEHQSGIAVMRSHPASCTSLKGCIMAVTPAASMPQQIVKRLPGSRRNSVHPR
jgi:hypothetical protein